MIRRRHHRKLFFPFGLLTLGVLHFFLCAVVQRQLFSHNYNAIEVNITTRDLWTFYKRTQPDLDIPPAGRWRPFRFTPDARINTAVLHLIQSEVDDFSASRDTAQGLRIDFPPQTPYGTFVRTLDMLTQSGVVRYAISGPTIWMPKYPKTKPIPPLQYTGPMCSGVFFLDTTPKLPYLVRAVAAIRRDLAYVGHVFELIPFSIWLVLFAYCILNMYQVYRYRHELLACGLTRRSRSFGATVLR